MLRIALICVGRVKAGAERTLADHYIRRAAAAGRGVGVGVQLRELVESRARRPEERKVEEAMAIRAQLVSGARLVTLDERGDLLDSVAFARLIEASRDAGTATLALAIGGADGLDPALCASADTTIAFGPMTWPHQLVRVMAAEQLYRAVTILSGHPYHRA